jgi:tetratricopeptide (TPR) repeat protein
MARPTKLAWIARALAAAMLLAACSATRTEQEASALHYFKRGNVAMEQEDYGRAVRMYQQAASLDPRAAAIQYNLGLAYYRVEALPEAVQAYQRALKLDPNFADAHLNLALAHDRLYNLESAQSHFNAYQRLARSQAASTAESAKVSAPAKPQAAAAQTQPGGGPAATGRLPDAAAPENPAPKRAVGGGKSGTPQPISEIRRLGPGKNAGKPSQPSGGDGKWWTQDSTPKNR